MSFLKDISKQLKSMPVLFAGLAVLVIAFVLYNNRKGMLFSNMANQNMNEAPQMNSPDVQAADPAGMNSGPGSATGVRTITSGVGEIAYKEQQQILKNYYQIIIMNGEHYHHHHPKMVKVN